MKQKPIIQRVEVFGWQSALRGMRNPLDSWHKQDSVFSPLHIGENDWRLMTTLLKAGPEHRKFLRMIHVQFDLTVPRYIWSEFDTYHFNVKNSCSTMHTLLTKKKKIRTDMFSYDEELEPHMIEVVKELNRLRDIYTTNNEYNKGSVLQMAKAILPEGFMQKRTVDTNYEELLTMYRQRKNHRLSEWRDFCDFLLTLPYFKELVDELEK